MERGLEDMSSILKVEDLVKYYGEGENQVRAVDHTSLQIERGKFTAIVGRSGSGKSTLLHLIGGLDRPDSGKVWIDGTDIYSRKDDKLAQFRRKKIGFKLQDFAKMRGYEHFAQDMEEVYKGVRDSAYEIIERKGATYYGIGMAAEKIVEAIVRNSHTVAPISVSLDGKYGLEGLCLSIPTIVGRGGAEQVLEIDFSEEEMKKLRKSAEELGAVLDQVNIEK